MMQIAAALNADTRSFRQLSLMYAFHRYKGKRERKKMPRWKRAARKNARIERFEVSPWDNPLQTPLDRMDPRNVHLHKPRL